MQRLENAEDRRCDAWPSVAVTDTWMGRTFWSLIPRLAAVVGPVRARKAASVLLRCLSTTDRGYMRSVYRVSRPTLKPEIVKLPQAWSTLSPHVHVRRLGLELDLDLRDNLQRILYYTGTYEPATLEFLHSELRAGDVFVDIGAHIGVHSLTVAARLRELGSGRVFAFEPARDSADKLRAAAARNGLAVTVVEAALGCASGADALFSDPDFDPADAGVRSLYGRGAPVQTVRVMPFDDWARQRNIDRLDLVKIDVEGAEVSVIRGMSESLRRFRPRALVVEIKPANMVRAGSGEAGLRDLLRKARYEGTETAGHRNEVFRPM